MAKRTRRERRLEGDKQPGQFTPKATPAESPIAQESPSPMLTEEFVPAPVRTTQTALANNRKAAAVNFAEEYYYEYDELKKILTIAAILFMVMIGMSFVI